MGQCNGGSSFMEFLSMFCLILWVKSDPGAVLVIFWLRLQISSKNKTQHILVTRFKNGLSTWNKHFFKEDHANGQQIYERC